MKVDTGQPPTQASAALKGQITRRQIIILVIAWLVSIGIGYQVYGIIAGPVRTATPITTVSVRRGTVSVAVTAPGTVVATKQAKLTFSASGKIAEIPVNLGDSVKAGQVLGKLDTASLEISLAQAQSNLRVAQIKLQQAQKGGTTDEIAAAQASYDSAVAKYNDLAKGPTESEIKSAEQLVVSAQTAYDKVVADLQTVQVNPDPDGIQAASLALEQAKDSLWKTQIDRDGTCGPNNKSYQCQAGNAGVASSEMSVQKAALDLQKAQVSQGKALANAQKTVDSAKASLDSAQANLAEVKAGATQAELLAAQNTVASAKSALTKAQSSTPEEITLAEETVKQNEASLRLAQFNLDNATIKAPFDGVVASIGGNVGEQAASGTAMFTLVDPTAVRIDVNVPEADVAKVAVGKNATITLDALANQTFQGKVSAVSPTATVSSGVASYLVSISVDSKAQSIPPGLSASASIITEQKENVLFVPSRAVKTTAGVRNVEVQTADGKSETRIVQVGLNGDAGMEITSGLNEGDQVVVKATTSSSNLNGNTRASGGAVMGGGPVMIKD